MAPTFRLWAPAAKTVELIGDLNCRLEPADNGWHFATVQAARAGTRYKFRIDDDIEVPDPASAFQPQDVSGPSEVIDHAEYRWQVADWRGRPWEEAGCLNCISVGLPRGGTFRAANEKLDHVAEAGFTAIDAACRLCWRRNWGYDGVLASTGFAALDTPLRRQHRNKEGCYACSNAQRSPSTRTLPKTTSAFVTKRRISGGTVSDKGRDARDVMLGLAKTCMKLKLSFYDFRGRPPRPAWRARDCGRSC